jgi:hypothetical protein
MDTCIDIMQRVDGLEKDDKDRRSAVDRLVMLWIPVAQDLPTPGAKVLATYVNKYNKPRRIIGHYIPAGHAECCCDDECDCEYDEDRDNYYYPAGWYESIENWHDFACVMVCDGEVSHWLPLPSPPGA